MQALSLSQKDFLEEGMTTHSSILAWKIPWIEEPGGLLSIGLQRAGYNWRTWHTHTHPLLCCSTFFSIQSCFLYTVVSTHSCLNCFSIHSCLRCFIMKGCWVSLHMFSVSFVTAILFLSFILLMWSVILTNLNMLNHPCSLGLSSTCLWWMFLLMCCWILIC